MKVVFDIAAGRVAIEGDGPELLKVLQVARSLAPDVKQIQIITSTEATSNSEAHSDEGSESPRTLMVTQPSHAPKTLRQFARALSLNSASEKITAIAYYVNKIEGRHSFSPKEMDSWFTMCGFQKPSQMPVAIFDAKRKYGYMENAGRAMWRISNQGENLIAAKLEEAGV